MMFGWMLFGWVICFICGAFFPIDIQLFLCLSIGLDLGYFIVALIVPTALLLFNCKDIGPCLCPSSSKACRTGTAFSSVDECYTHFSILC